MSEHLILGLSMGGLIVLEIIIGIVGLWLLKTDTARLDRTQRVLGALIVQESEKVQALLRD
jgi:hypothetical protein